MSGLQPMSTITLWTDEKALVEDLAKLQRHEKTFLYLRGGGDTIPITLSISDYHVIGLTNGVVSVQKR